jgi:hypothetical protein
MPISVANSTAPTRAPACAGEVFANDERVRGHNAALEKSEQRRDHEQRGHAVEGQEHQQGHALQHRAEHQRAQSADAIGDQPGDHPAGHAEAKHHRQHLAPRAAPKPRSLQ